MFSNQQLICDILCTWEIVGVTFKLAIIFIGVLDVTLSEHVAIGMRATWHSTYEQLSISVHSSGLAFCLRPA